MRDLETISTAITAAETAILYFLHLHTNNAYQTVNRIIDVFPPHQQQQVRIQLANTLIGVVSEASPRSDKRTNPGIRNINNYTSNKNLIREGKHIKYFLLYKPERRIWYADNGKFPTACSNEKGYINLNMVRIYEKRTP